MADQDARQPIKRLSALERVFDATGVAEIRCGAKTLELPIRAVDMELVEGIIKPYRPKPPTRDELRNGKRITLINEADERYQEQLAEYNRVQTYAYVCCALDLDIEDDKGDVVWSADNEVHNLEASKKALKSMGIVDGQLLTITSAALNLTRLQEEEQASD